jgi:hypothetical protein
MASAAPVYTPENTPFHGSAIVEVTDTMPAAPAPSATPAPWWMDPWKLGAIALGAVVLLQLLTPRRN